MTFSHVDLGRLDEARVEFGRIAADGFESIPAILGQWLVAIALLCETAVALGDAERAAELHLDAVRRFATRW